VAAAAAAAAAKGREQRAAAVAMMEQKKAATAKVSGAELQAAILKQQACDQPTLPYRSATLP
jgi:hypothetical protein